VIEPLPPATLEVYVVTSSGNAPGRGHREVARAAVAGGATAVQLRAPELADQELLPLARELTAYCREHGVLFMVNNRIEVALEGGADGVHVGQGDHPERARDLLGPDPVLGVSVEGPGQAREAEHLGASYVAATVWSSETKPEAAPLGTDDLREVCAATSLPVVGIGGITASNAEDVLAVGAAGVAVISAVGAAADPEAATRELVDVVRAYREKG
jgi:thiamine-phosphate pyrophosphorylase